jgi:hypothetical protein
MAVISHQRRPKARLLLRRLMVTCPVTGVSVDTGHELTAIPGIGPGPELLVDCIECGQDHAWRMEDAFFEP